MLRGEAPVGTGNIYVKDIDSEPFEPMRISRGPRTRVYVKIEDGCESRCSYCAIPSARGKVRSKPMEQVIEEVEALRDSGVREVVLTGIETGSWGRDLSGELDLGDLLRELDRRGSAERIRLGSLAPELMGESFARKTCDLKILAPHFHISVQSGSDKVLRAMRRRHNSATALENIMRLRALIPEAQFTTDLMVGFPGETEEDFDKTREFLERAQFIDTHVFAYSRRHNTPAASFGGQIPEQVKRRRSEELIKAAEQVRDRVLDRIIARGEPLPCIFESQKCKVWFAHSHNFAAVAVRTEEVDLAGESRLVTPLYREGGIIYGEIKK
jgi:threonylcarbamoyladenosine tRNA methylthiotransferase MtaB